VKIELAICHHSWARKRTRMVCSLSVDAVVYKAQLQRNFRCELISVCIYIVMLEM
jgi:hypothetical protein